MILIVLFGISLMFVFSCVPETSFRFSKITKTNVANFDTDFAAYCKREPSTDFEQSAVWSAIYGDYKNALEYATEDAVPRSFDLSYDENATPQDVLNRMRERLSDANLTLEERARIHVVLDLIKREKNLDLLFRDKIQVDAREYIISEAGRYHFLLINEAHYSSQNREFTADLLKPLWEKGYRYLALEALSYSDIELSRRGYPVLNSGFYVRDPVFGNMVREALAIGYRLIAYETERAGVDGSERDLDQARNIFNKTLRNDSIGKVIIHAGYSHILENGGGTYIPMGVQLKSISKQDILTIDQETMTDLNQDEKLNPYYLYVKYQLRVGNPVIFMGEKPLVDPINYAGIDVQVYHPPTKFIKGRPTWRLRTSYQLVELPPGFEKFNGCLIQALRAEDRSDAIPIDQTIVYPDVGLVLQPGNYNIRVINGEGVLIATCRLEVE